MLKSLYRFHRRNAVQRVHRKGRQVRGTQLSLKHLENRSTSSRLAVVVSKKVDKRAVVRNRIRRRVYELVRKNWSQLEPGHDIVISVFDASLAKLPASVIEADIVALLKKAQLFKG